MFLEPGHLLDAKYRVSRRIGEGGMGTVYEGEHSRIGRRVAIKVLHGHVASLPGFVERFEREARAAARIGSAHVCDVLDFGEIPGGYPYIVMEFLDGESFEERILTRGRLTPVELAPIAFELLEGLATMHSARVIHRDLKPANVFLARTTLGRGEIVKILDFGVAKLLPFEGEVGTMTQTGTMMGTPLYMSPEQARGGRDLDGRTDIYSASVMFYRALTGTLPFNAETLNELLFKIALEEARPLRELAPDVDEVFAALVHKGLAREVGARFSSSRAFQRALAEWSTWNGRKSLLPAGELASEPRMNAPANAQAAAAASSSSLPGAGAHPSASSTPSGLAPGTPTAWSDSEPDPQRAGSWRTKTVSLEAKASGVAAAHAMHAPHVTPSGAMSGAMPPSATPPGASPGAMTPGATPPGAMPPSATPPGASPGAMTPGATPPGMSATPPGAAPSGPNAMAATPAGVVGGDAGRATAPLVPPFGTSTPAAAQQSVSASGVASGRAARGRRLAFALGGVLAVSTAAVAVAMFVGRGNASSAGAPSTLDTATPPSASMSAPSATVDRPESARVEAPNVHDLATANDPTVTDAATAVPHQPATPSTPSRAHAAQGAATGAAVTLAQPEGATRSRPNAATTEAVTKGKADTPTSIRPPPSPLASATTTPASTPSTAASPAPVASSSGTTPPKPSQPKPRKFRTKLDE